MTAVPAVLNVAIAQGGLGGGLGIVCVPLMALSLSPTHPAAIMLPILIPMDIHALWNFRYQGDWRNPKLLLPAALLGILLGTFTFRHLSATQIRILVGAIAISFVLHTNINGGNRQPKLPNRITGSFWGNVAGFTSFGVHAGGPPLYFSPWSIR